jgi:hypothetical protein
MKACIINLLLLPALIAGLGLIPAGRVTAQTFTTLHTFTYGSDGDDPYAGLILSYRERVSPGKVIYWA